MKTTTIVALLMTVAACSYLAAPARGASAGDEELAVTQSRADSAEQHVLGDGTYEAWVGARPRPHLDFYGFPTVNALGSILGFRASGSGHGGSFIAGSPILAYGSRLTYPVYSSLTATDDGTTVHAVANGELGDPRRRFAVSTTYSLRPGSGIVDVRSRLEAIGSASLEGVSYSLHFEAGPFFAFSPFDADRHPRLRLEVLPRADDWLGWVDLNPRDDAGAVPQVTVAPGGSHEVRYALVVARDGGGLLATIYRLLEVEATPVEIQLENLEAGPFEIVIRDPVSGSVFFRTFREDSSPVAATLPPGTYSVTGNLFPAVVETALTVGGEATACTLTSPARGRVRIALEDEAGDPVPGRVTFLGLDPTPSPYFRPHDPVTSGRAWEEVKNSVFPGLAGLELELPVGTYLVSASRGPEHTLDQKVVEVLADRLTDLCLRVDRVVDTVGLVAVDPHLHTLASDGSVTDEERVLSVVAEGVEVAVATDHFRRRDLAPAVRAAGLTAYLTVIAGSEISIRNPNDFEYTLDFNLYPLDPGVEVWSAAETLADEVAPIFEATRRKHPKAVIQINHPRYSSWDYLNSYQLDPESAATAREGFWTGFDVLEVLNGPSLHSSSNSSTVRDWLNLLARGYFFPAVASSDAHQIDTEEAGYSRTYVYVDDGEIEKMDLDAVVDGLRSGRSFVTNGPIVEVTADGRHLPGDTLVSTDGEVDLHIEVRAAPWVPVDEVRVLVNREIAEVFAVEAAPGSVQRFSRDVHLDLEEDAFLVVVVTGTGSLFPVVQQRSQSGRAADAVTPFAMTNPVFIDVDGNGRFDPPLPTTIRPISSSSE